MKTITFVPAGGLGNRMKAISSAILLSRQSGSRLNILWFQDWGLGCRFDQLFESIDTNVVSLRSPRWIDYILFDRPRRKNFFVPSLFQHLLFRATMYERTATKNKDCGFDFTEWAKGRNVWLSSNVYFMNKKVPECAFDEFHPIEALRKRISERLKACGPDVVGVHIRRTDNMRSVKESPTEAFIELMRKEPETTKFYLATDDESEKSRLKAEFPGRIITQSEKAERGSVNGMQDALVEMYTLAGCRKIYGSCNSTFSETAAIVGKIPLVVVRR